MNLTRRQRSVLSRRIARQPGNQKAHEASEALPVTTMGTTHPAPPVPMTMPLTLVQVTASGQQVAEAIPLYAGPRGAPIPATGPGQWVQLYAAGRP